MQKYHILPNLKGEVTQIKKTTERWSLQHEKINLKIVAYFLIKILELLTSEFQYLGIKVSKKKTGFILISCLSLDSTSFKIERNGKPFRKRCQNFTSRTLSCWLYEDITCSGLHINTKEKLTNTKKKFITFKKMER